MPFFILENGVVFDIVQSGVIDQESQLSHRGSGITSLDSIFLF